MMTHVHETIVFISRYGKIYTGTRTARENRRAIAEESARTIRDCRENREEQCRSMREAAKICRFCGSVFDFPFRSLGRAGNALTFARYRFVRFSLQTDYVVEGEGNGSPSGNKGQPRPQIIVLLFWTRRSINGGPFFPCPVLNRRR